MQFKIENLGFIDKGEINLNNITVICGENNVGKTYLNYSIYGFLKKITSFLSIDIKKEDFELLKKNGILSIDLKYYESIFNFMLRIASEEYTKNLNKIFNSEANLFKKTSFLFKLKDFKADYSKKISKNIESSNNKIILNHFKEKDSHILKISLFEFDYPDNLIGSFIGQTVLEIFLGELINKSFIITSERTGISLFYKELDISKNILVEKLTTSNGKEINYPYVVSEMVARYPLPIKDNIDYIRDLDQILTKNKSFIFEEGFNNKDILKTWEKLLGGKFRIINNEIYFVPQKERKRDKVEPIPMYMSSSSSKSLLSLDLYIKSIAKPNQILIIDEPELNLHPSKQIYMARLLAQLSNIGVKVLISTHSDFLIKELNNLIMLSNNFKDKSKIMKKYDYNDLEILNKDNINFYIASKDHTLKKIETTNTGVDLESFDNVILDINSRSDEIFYSLQGLENE